MNNSISPFYASYDYSYNIDSKDKDEFNYRHKRHSKDKDENFVDKYFFDKSEEVDFNTISQGQDNSKKEDVSQDNFFDGINSCPESNYRYPDENEEFLQNFVEETDSNDQSYHEYFNQDTIIENDYIFNNFEVNNNTHHKNLYNILGVVNVNNNNTNHQNLDNVLDEIDVININNESIINEVEQSENDVSKKIVEIYKKNKIFFITFPQILDYILNKYNNLTEKKIKISVLRNRISKKPSLEKLIKQDLEKNKKEYYDQILSIFNELKPTPLCSAVAERQIKPLINEWLVKKGGSEITRFAILGNKNLVFLKNLIDSHVHIKKKRKLGVDKKKEKILEIFRNLNTHLCSLTKIANKILPDFNLFLENKGKNKTTSGSLIKFMKDLNEVTKKITENKLNYYNKIIEIFHQIKHSVKNCYMAANAIEQPFNIWLKSKELEPIIAINILQKINKNTELEEIKNFFN